jgi:raffinose/stachyose/melibiose transport system substrate-binding protein
MSRFMQRNGLRMVCATGIAAVMVAALAGCSTSDSPPSTGSKALTVATDNPAPLKAVVDAFTKANPGVTVKIQDGGSTYQDFIRTGLAAGTAADVIRTFPGSGNTAAVGPLNKAGALVDLSSSSWTDKLSPTQKSLFSAKGKVLSVPIGALALGPVYDDQTLESLGLSVPTTFAEVLTLCNSAKAAGKVAYSLFQKGGSVLPSYAMVAPLVYGPNPAFTTQQIAGKKSFAQSGWVKAFDIQLQMNKAGCFNDGPNGTDYNATAAQIAQGKAVATFAFSDTTSFEQSSPKGTTFTIAPFPVGADAKDRYLSVADSSGFGINAKAKNPTLAGKFVAFLASAEAQNAYGTASKGAPAIPNSSFVPANKNQKTIVEYQKSKHIATWPDQGWPGTATGQALDDVSQTLFGGTDTPQSAAKKMDDAFAKDLASGKN